MRKSLSHMQEYVFPHHFQLAAMDLWLKKQLYEQVFLILRNIYIKLVQKELKGILKIMSTFKFDW